MTTANPRICIVADRADGLHPLCPTALAAGLLARTLGQECDEVTLIAVSAPAGDTTATEWCDAFDAVCVRLECLYLPPGNDNYRSLHVFRHLRSRNFTHILFLDRGAPGYWSIRAQRQGLSFQDTSLILVVADPTPLDLRTPHGSPKDPQQLVTLEMESFLLGQAQTVLATSAGLATYVSQHPEAPEPVTIEPFLPAAMLQTLGDDAFPRARDEVDPGTGQPPSVVSLGLLGLADRAGGVTQAAAAVLAQGASEIPHIGEIIAIGGTGPVEGDTDGFQLLALALRGWPGNLELRRCRTLEEFAADVAAQPLVILDARPAGSGAVARWFALAVGHPVIDVAHGDAIAAEFATGLGKAWPLLPVARAFGAAFRESARDGAKRLAEAILQARHGSPRALPTGVRAMPKVSVCINHFDRPALLEQALDSLRKQTYSALEVVLYDDASPSERTHRYLDGLAEEFDHRGWKLVRGTAERWPAAGRNEAAKHATGDYVLIMDDDNVARPEEVEVLVSVALTTGADVVGCFAYLFEGDGVPTQQERLSNFGGWLAAVPLGHGTALASIWNIFGDVNYMYKIEVFRALGGFEDLPSIGCEDYQISLRTAQAGYRIEVVPLGLYDYRYSAQNMAKGISNERAYYSHLRISRLASSRFACPRIIFDLGAMRSNAEAQQNGWSYWSRPGRAPGRDPRADAPLWRQDTARLRLEAALHRYGCKARIRFG